MKTPHRNIGDSLAVLRRRHFHFVFASASLVPAFILAGADNRRREEAGFQTAEYSQDLHVSRRAAEPYFANEAAAVYTTNEGHSKSRKQHVAMQPILFAWYYFCRVHATIKATPAMVSGLDSRP
jgi:hypothetical protein